MDTRDRTDIKTRTPLKAKLKTFAVVFVTLVALVALVCLPSLTFGTESEDATPPAASSSTATVSDSMIEAQEATAGPISPVNEIADTVTPLAYGSDIGATWSLLNLICVAFGLVWSAVLLITLYRKAHHDTADEVRSSNVTGEEQSFALRRNFRGYIIAASLGGISLIVFLFTENMALPMVWVDAFSPLMVLFVIAQDLITLRLLKREDLDNEISPHPAHPTVD
jgi:hypothetical protein